MIEVIMIFMLLSTPVKAKTMVAVTPLPGSCCNLLDLNGAPLLNLSSARLQDK